VPTCPPKPKPNGELYAGFLSSLSGFFSSFYSTLLSAFPNSELGVFARNRGVFESSYTGLTSSATGRFENKESGVVKTIVWGFAIYSKSDGEVCFASSTIFGGYSFSGSFEADEICYFLSSCTTTGLIGMGYFNSMFLGSLSTRIEVIALLAGPPKAGD
jgi:hypothetical protein